MHLRRPSSGVVLDKRPLIALHCLQLEQDFTSVSFIYNLTIFFVNDIQ